MNFVVVLLLLVQDRDPERAFWLLTALVQGRLAPATYAPNLDGCHVEMRTLGQLLGDKQKPLASHLQVEADGNGDSQTAAVLQV